jgi:hypothetical protein
MDEYIDFSDVRGKRLGISMLSERSISNISELNNYSFQHVDWFSSRF